METVTIRTPIHTTFSTSTLDSRLGTDSATNWPLIARDYHRNRDKYAMNSDYYVAIEWVMKYAFRCECDINNAMILTDFLQITLF